MFQFDCHAHVYESIAAVSKARYIPKSPAPLKQWQKNLKNHKLKGGVIVQVSFLGADNSQLCNALEKLDKKRFAGVAVVPLDVSDAELDMLVNDGIRGLRWNLVKGAEVPILTSPMAKSFFKKLRIRNLHLEIHLEGPRLASLLPTIADQGINIVVDHFGLPSEPMPKDDPMITALSTLQDRKNVFFKFSAHYRTPFSLLPHGQEIMSLLPDGHVVWGSDWPHTQYEAQQSYEDNYQTATLWSDESEHSAMQTLYGIK